MVGITVKEGESYESFFEKPSDKKKRKQAESRRRAFRRKQQDEF
jgi:ribosomal protein S21